MASARLLSKNIILSRKLNEVSEGAENLYYRLLVMSDDFGCYHADPGIIKGQLYTLRKISLSIIEKRLEELKEIHLIKMYPVNGESYIQIKKFEEYQRFRSDIKRKSEFPTFEQRSRDVSDTTRNVEPSPVSRNRSNNRSENEDIGRIVTYLNEKAGKNFSINSNETINLVSGRLSDGYTVEQFIEVIDKKVSKWGDDIKMCDYLRPSTLFRKSNFENYLNEKEPKAEKSAIQSRLDELRKEQNVNNK